MKYKGFEIDIHGERGDYYFGAIREKDGLDPFGMIGPYSSKATAKKDAELSVDAFNADPEEYEDDWEGE